MKVTVVQTNSISDKGKNIAQATELIDRAVAMDRPDLVVLPEVWSWRGGTTADKVREAEATLRRWRALAGDAEDGAPPDAGVVEALADDLNTPAALARLHQMAREIADNPAVVVQGVKQVLAFGEGGKIADAERFVAVWNSAFLASTDLSEAIQAFMERRPPKFANK